MKNLGAKKGIGRLAIVGTIVVIILVAAVVASWYSLEQERLRQEKLKQTIVIGTTEKISRLDPAKAYDFYTWEVMTNIGEGLMKYKPGTTELEGGVATNYTVSASGLNYTFTLREGLKFNDGTPLNATAVKGSIERVINLNQDPAWLVRDFVDSVVVVDTYKVKINLKDAYSYFPALLATPTYFPISSKAFPANAVKDVTDGWHGPYKVTKWEKDVVLELEANPEYYGTQPKSRYVVVKFIKDAITLRFAIQNADIDIAWRTLRPIDISDLKTIGELKVTEAPGPYIRCIVLNTNTTMHPDNVKLLRQAIAAAVNRTTIAEKVFLGTVMPLYSVVPEGMWGHIDVFREKYGDANYTLARQLLRQAGYNDTNKLVLNLWYTPTYYGYDEDDLAEALRDDLDKTDMIWVRFNSAEWATYRSEYMVAGTMPMFLFRWHPDYFDPDGYLSPFIASEEGLYSLGTFYHNATLNSILMEARGESAVEDRAQLYEEAQWTFAEDVPVVPLFQEGLYAFSLANVEGVFLDPTMVLRYYLIYKEGSLMQTPYTWGQQVH